MPVYDIELSDGRTVTIEGDKEPSESDVMSALGHPQQPAQLPPGQRPYPEDAPIEADPASFEPQMSGKEAFKSFVPLPDLIKGETVPGKVGAALANTGIGFAGAAASPGGLLSLPLGALGRLGHVAGGLGFGVPAVTGGLKRVYQGAALGDLQEALEGGLQTGTGGLITMGGVKGLLPKATPLEPIPSIIKEGPINANEVTSTSGVPVEQQGVPVDRPAEVQAEGGTPQRTSEDEQAIPQPAQTPEAVAPPDLVGMGGALKEGEIPETGAGGEKYGISQRLREERAQAGQVEPIEPGIGTTGEQSVALGNQLLDQGFDAPKALADFEATGAANPDSLTAIRQYGERLFANARKVEQEFGTDSDQYREALKTGTDWDKRSKPIATAAHKLMVAHQGETDLDTGTYTGLARAWADATDRDFTPKQKATAEVIAGNSSQATEAATKQLGEYAGFMDRATKAPVAEVAALDAASKTVREAAATMAEAENKARVASTVREQAEAAVKTNAEKAALGAASKTVRENAIRIAKEDSLKRVEEAKRNQAVADIEVARTKKALQAATDNARRAAIAAAKQEVKNRVAQADLVRTVWDHIKTNYLDKGRNDPGDIFTGTATDLGMSAKKVREILGSPKGANRILNEVYKKLSDQRRIVQAAKVWLKEQERPGIERFVSKIPRAFFIGKIFGHGTALHVTHSATQAFNPYVADIWWKSFAQQWPFAYKPGYAEMIIRDTLNDKNYTTARRFGLDNDFTSASGDYQAATSKFKGVMRTLAGTKGTDGLKVLRQNIFNRFWDQMPQSTKTATAGKKLAVSVNHMTGSMGATTKVPQTLQWLLFAPKLEGSRWGYSFGDSVKDGMTIARWSKASAEDKHLAKQDIKQKAAIAGVYFSLLTANQGLLSASDSNQKINFFDPTKSDWLSFKILGHKVGLIGPMIGEVRFLANMIKTGMENRDRKHDTRTAAQQKNLLDYARGKLSPAAGDVSDIGLTQSDFAGRPLPWSDDKVPLYLRRRGEGKYTYPQYAISQLPIPFEEAAREAWAEQGVDEPTINKWLKVLSTGAAALTGARVSKDYDAK